MLQLNKNNFSSRMPFGQRNNYLIWLKISSGLLLSLILFLFYWSFHSYQKYQYLLMTRSSLLASVSKFDEVVRKKNKLLVLAAGQTKQGKKSYGIHAKIVDYLKQIENKSIIFNRNKIRIRILSFEIIIRIIIKRRRII